MKLTKRNMEEVLSDTRVMLDNTKKNDEIKALLIRYGIDDERIDEGYEKRNTAEELFRGKKTKIGDQITVSAELEGKFDIAYKQYMGYVKLSRILLADDPGARKTLGVDGIRDRTFAGFLAQARQFYLGVQNNGAIFEKLKRFLVSKENLQAQLDLLLEVETINSDQENKKGQSQEATLLRNMAFKDLFQYRAEYTISARLALAERSQLLDSLGILARSEGYKRKRKKDNEEEPENQPE